MVGYLEFTLNVAILVLELLGLLDDALSFHFILFFPYFFVEPVLLHGEQLHMTSHLSQLALFHLQSLLELQLRGKKLIIDSSNSSIGLFDAFLQ